MAAGVKPSSARCVRVRPRMESDIWDPTVEWAFTKSTSSAGEDLQRAARFTGTEARDDRSLSLGHPFRFAIASFLLFGARVLARAASSPTTGSGVTNETTPALWRGLGYPCSEGDIGEPTLPKGVGCLYWLWRDLKACTFGSQSTRCPRCQGLCACVPSSKDALIRPRFNQLGSVLRFEPSDARCDTLLAHWLPRRGTQSRVLHYPDAHRP